MKTKQAASGAALLAAARLTSRALDFVALLVVARFLSPADFGVIAVAMTLIVIVEAVLDLPVGLVLIRIPVLDAADLDTAFTLAAIRAMTLAATVALLAWPFGYFYEDPRLFNLICLLSIAPASRGLVSPRMAAFAKQLNFKPDFIAEVTGKTAAMVMTVSIAASTSSYWALVAGTVTAPLTTSLVSYLLAPYKPRLSLTKWRIFAEFLGWGSAAQVVSAINWQCDRLVLGRLIPQSALGQFSMANDLSVIPFQMLVVPTMRSVMPAFVSLGDSLDRLRAAYEKTVGGVAAVTVPVMIGLSLLAEPGIRLTLGGKWLSAVPILQWIALACIPDMLVAPLGALAMTLNQTNIFFRLNITQLVVKLPLMIIGAVSFGVAGVVGVRLATSLMICVVSMSYTRKLIGLSIKRQALGPWRVVTSAGVMVLIVLVMRSRLAELQAGWLALGLAEVVAVSAATYAAALIALWKIAGMPRGIEMMVFDHVGRAFRRWRPQYSR